MSLLCEQGISLDPCGECKHCRAIARGDHPDWNEVDAASNGGVDAMRKLVEYAAGRPVMARRRGVIIDEQHRATAAADDVLLKPLEEARAGMTFVLCTSEPESVIPTIRSRCQELYFHPLQVEDVQANLRMIVEKEAVSLTDAAIKELALVTRGGLREAQSLLGQLAVLNRAVARCLEVAAGASGSISELEQGLVKIKYGQEAGRSTIDRLNSEFKTTAMRYRRAEIF
jgi:DNA polymerase-3 subunit gamma/tau